MTDSWMQRHHAPVDRTDMPVAGFCSAGSHACARGVLTIAAPHCARTSPWPTKPMYTRPLQKTNHGS